MLLLGLLLVLQLVGSAIFGQVISPQEIKTQKMKEFILLIRLSINYGPQQASEVREQWKALTDQWKSDGIFVTSFIAPTDGYVVAGKDGHIEKKAIEFEGAKLITSIIISATDIEQATRLAQLCPVLRQGGTIEVKETQPRLETTNKEVVRFLYETILNSRKFELLGDVISPDYVGVDGGKGVEGFSNTVSSVIAGFPDIKWTIDDITSGTDKVIVRWHWTGTHTGSFRGLPASHKQVTDHAIVIYQLKDGKITQAWMQGDRLGVLTQIGGISEELVTGS